MSAAWFRGLAAALADGTPVCLATVLETRGAVPRHRGAMLWCTADHSAGTVGGGLLEARVVDRARALLQAGTETDTMEIDLGGGPDSAGVCGGRMRIGLARWQGAASTLRAGDVATTLDAGRAVLLSAEETGGVPIDIAPEPLLLILGAGHCGSALAQQAAWLGYRLAVFDPRADLLSDPAFATARTFHGEASVIAPLLGDDTLVAVLLNRDWHADVAGLRVLAESPPRYVGMMGSRRRVHQVRSTIPELVARFPVLDAPLGLGIGAETPEEIAVSILARLVAFRRLGPGAPRSPQQPLEPP